MNLSILLCFKQLVLFCAHSTMMRESVTDPLEGLTFTE